MFYLWGSRLRQLSRLLRRYFLSKVHHHQKKQTRSKLSSAEAAALIDSKGKAAFANLRKKDSEWFHGDTYLFVYDTNANVLLNPAFPKREGTNVSGQKDAKGKLFHNEIIKTAETKGSGWVDYMFPKPGQTELSQKWTFVKKVTINNDEAWSPQASIQNRH